MLTNWAPLRMVLPDPFDRMQFHLNFLSWAQFGKYDVLIMVQRRGGILNTMNLFTLFVAAGGQSSKTDGCSPWGSHTRSPLVTVS